jgi:predicted transcriptional regulator
MTENTVLVVTVGEESAYERGLEAIQRLKRGAPVTDPPTVQFASEEQLFDVFNARTLELLRAIRGESPGSIRETARLVDRDVKNVHGELTRLEALGVIDFQDDGAAKRPVFPYDDLVISPFGHGTDDTATVAP